MEIIRGINYIFFFTMIFTFIFGSCRETLYIGNPEIVMTVEESDLVLKWTDEDPLELDYKVCYGEITSRISSPVGPHLENGIINCWDLGRQTEVRVGIPDKTKIWYFILQGSKGQYKTNWSKPKYFPYNPYGEERSDPWLGYIYTLGSTITLSWEHAGAEWYEVQAILEGTTDTYYNFESTSLTIAIDRPGSVGIYKFRVRACVWGEDGDLCSYWCDGSNGCGKVTVNGIAITGNHKSFWNLYTPIFL